MKKPIDPTVAELVDMPADNLAEMFQERAAVREYDGGYPRRYAEAVPQDVIPVVTLSAFAGQTSRRNCIRRLDVLARCCSPTLQCQ